MLALKKIPKKKLAIYISIIILMLVGIGYMLCINQLWIFEKPMITNNPEPSAPVATTTDQLNIIKLNKKNNKFDLNIFLNGKFKELKDNILIYKDKPTTGKKDPFKPE